MSSSLSRLLSPVEKTREHQSSNSIRTPQKSQNRQKIKSKNHLKEFFHKADEKQEAQKRQQIQEQLEQEKLAIKHERQNQFKSVLSEHKVEVISAQSLDHYFTYDLQPQKPNMETKIQQILNNQNYMPGQPQSLYENINNTHKKKKEKKNFGIMNKGVFITWGRLRRKSCCCELCGNQFSKFELKMLNVDSIQKRNHKFFFLKKFFLLAIKEKKRKLEEEEYRQQSMNNFMSKSSARMSQVGINTDDKVSEIEQEKQRSPVRCGTFRFNDFPVKRQEQHKASQLLGRQKSITSRDSNVFSMFNNPNRRQKLDFDNPSSILDMVLKFSDKQQKKKKVVKQIEKPKVYVLQQNNQRHFQSISNILKNSKDKYSNTNTGLSSNAQSQNSLDSNQDILQKSNNSKLSHSETSPNLSIKLMKGPPKSPSTSQFQFPKTDFKIAHQFRIREESYRLESVSSEKISPPPSGVPSQSFSSQQQDDDDDDDEDEENGNEKSNINNENESEKRSLPCSTSLSPVKSRNSLTRKKNSQNGSRQSMIKDSFKRLSNARTSTVLNLALLKAVSSTQRKDSNSNTPDKKSINSPVQINEISSIFMNKNDQIRNKQESSSNVLTRPRQESNAMSRSSNNNVVNHGESYYKAEVRKIRSEKKKATFLIQNLEENMHLQNEIIHQHQHSVPQSPLSGKQNTGVGFQGFNSCKKDLHEKRISEAQMENSETGLQFEKDEVVQKPQTAQQLNQKQQQNGEKQFILQHPKFQYLKIQQKKTAGLQRSYNNNGQMQNKMQQQQDQQQQEQGSLYKFQQSQQGSVCGSQKKSLQSTKLFSTKSTPRKHKNYVKPKQNQYDLYTKKPVSSERHRHLHTKNTVFYNNVNNNGNNNNNGSRNNISIGNNSSNNGSNKKKPYIPILDLQSSVFSPVSQQSERGFPPLNKSKSPKKPNFEGKKYNNQNNLNMNNIHNNNGNGGKKMQFNLKRMNIPQNLYLENKSQQYKYIEKIALKKYEEQQNDNSGIHNSNKNNFHI